MERCIRYLREFGFEYVELEVDRENGKAIHMYERHGFIASKGSGRTVVMRLNLGRKP
jgi:ribosomal protein S18 acetylase RimI-like enzyme